MKEFARGPIILTRRGCAIPVSALGAISQGNLWVAFLGKTMPKKRKSKKAYGPGLSSPLDFPRERGNLTADD